MRDNTGKNKFFRTLNLDENTRKLLKVYRKIKQEMENEPEGKK